MADTTDTTDGTTAARWHDHPCDWRHGRGVLIDVDVEEDGAAHGMRTPAGRGTLLSASNLTVRPPARAGDRFADGQMIDGSACGEPGPCGHPTTACTTACAPRLARPPAPVEHTVTRATGGHTRMPPDAACARCPSQGQAGALSALPLPPSLPRLRPTRYPTVMDRDEQRTHFTTAEAAALLGITQQGVHSAIRRGHLQTELVNPRLRLIPRRAIEAYRQERLGQVGRPPRTKRPTRTRTAAEAAAAEHHTVDEGGAIHPPEETTDGHDA